MNDFDFFNNQIWQKATHSWSANNAQFVQQNAVLQDGYYRAIFSMGAGSNNNSNSGDFRLASASIAISTDGGTTYTSPSLFYAGGNVESNNDYGSATCNIILKLNVLKRVTL